MKPAITQERLRELLHYDPETGRFTNKVRRTISTIVGGEPGTTTKGGYRRIQLDTRFYMAHRLAWLYVYGEHPSDQVDHINGDTADNRITNLRVVNQVLNSQNQRGPRKNTTSGALGVCINPANRFRPFTAAIKVNGRVIYLGGYKTLEEASAVYVEAKRKYHPACTI